MRVTNTRESFFLLIGDLVIFTASLWLALLLRYFNLPGEEVFMRHFEPFAILFLVWILVFFIAGLYEKHTLFLKSRLPSTILNAQVANSVIAVLFFYLIPYFAITPKTNLFIYLVVSFALILLWRNLGPRLLTAHRREKALLIGSGEEMRELQREINGNPRYSLEFVSMLDLSEVEGVDFHREIINRVYAEGITLVVIDIHNDNVSPILPHLYNLIFSGVHFMDMHKVYEEIFNRVPISLLQYSWFLDNLSHRQKALYSFFKRFVDLVFSLVLFIPVLIITPFVALAIKIDDGGRVFYIQKRLGKNNRVIRIWKFRTMADGDYVTRVGNMLRKLRIDELPQLTNVIRGDLSLIGPRPEIPELAQEYEEGVPYYNVRHLIKPGLSGWAQIYQEGGAVPKFAVQAEATKRKLSYDLYYIKNRSFFLDLKVLLRTIETVLSRTGR